MTFNLIEQQWIPVQTERGKKRKIAPWEITNGWTDDPIVKLDAPRPDFNGALIQFLIGLVQTAFPPQDEDEWADMLDDPPDAETLRRAFRVVSHAFNLDGDGPRFMQDLTLVEGKTYGVRALLIDMPAGKTIEDNTDHFIKRDTVKRLCPNCSATALFTLQTNAPQGGAGHRTSLRGGGPLTTLIISEPMSLWRTVWLNTLPEKVFLSNVGGNPKLRSDFDRFPWLAPTRTSGAGAGGPTLSEDVHPTQVYWGMPRRIRLKFQGSMGGKCDICHEDSPTLLSDYMTKNHGVNYEGAWRHPLTPHQRNDDGSLLPLHAHPGGVTYRNWLGLVATDEEAGIEPAFCVVLSREVTFDPDRPIRLWAFGYDMNNMKARCWYEGIMPIPTINSAIRSRYDSEVARLVRAAQEVGGNLLSCLKNAWFDRSASVRGNLAFVQRTFWQTTESKFYQILNSLQKALISNEDVIRIRQEWLRVISDESISVFDNFALGGSVQDENPKRIALARNDLKKWNRGKKIVTNCLDLPTKSKESLKMMASSD